MNGAVVEFDTLTDSDRTRTENNDLFLVGLFSVKELKCFVLLVIGRVEVRCLSLEFACAGVNHFVNEVTVLRAFLTAYALNSAVEVAITLCKVVFIIGECAVCKVFFKLNKVFELGDEPVVDPCDLMYLINGNSTL